MKIGILTFTDGTNLGQRLQNFALQDMIAELVPECTVLTIKQSYPFSRVKQTIKKIIAFFCNPKHEIMRMNRKKHFDKFNNKHIEFYSKIMPFHGDNSIFSKEFDCFVVGSDQIWNPNSPFVGENFFLTFAERRQRITYAPSFSVDKIPIDKVDSYKNYLSGFSKITVREDAGARIVRDLTGKSAEVVLDPTLLVDKCKYDRIKVKYKKKPKNNYILAIFLGNQPETDIEIISKIVGQDIFFISQDTVIGPDEFLDVLENSNLVLTDSYHVTIFSIIYHRPFINFVRSGKGAIMNSRFETLYRILNISDRTWNYLQQHQDNVLSMEFDSIDRHLENEKNRSTMILKNSLNEMIRKEDILWEQ